MRGGWEVALGPLFSKHRGEMLIISDCGKGSSVQHKQHMQ